MLRFADSFSHYVTADFAKKYTSTVGTCTISAGNGLYGSSFRITSNTAQLIKTLDSQATWIVGFRYRNSAPTSNANGHGLCGLRDSGTKQVELTINGTGQLEIRRNNTVLANSGANTISASIWYYVEWKMTIADSISASTCIVRVNGTDWITLAAGTDTKNTSNATANQIYLGEANGVSGSTPTVDWCDFYVCDSTGSTNNDFLGDIRVEPLYPGGAGNSTQWTPSAGANYECVDEANLDSDTTYVSSATATQKDLYALGNMASTPSSIKGIQVCTVARKDDAGARTICPVLRTESTDYDLTNISLGDSYQIHCEVKELNPNTSAAWTATQIDALEAGVKLVS